MLGKRILVFVAMLGLAGMVAAAGLGDLLKATEDALDSGSKSGSRSGSGSATTGAGLSEGEIGGGLRQALSIGAERAVAVLGRSGGYLDDPQVRIPLPGVLERTGKVLRKVGYGSTVDEFETTVNRAAEQAVPKTLPIVKQTVQNMTLADARGILNGGDDAATRYLRDKAGDQLHAAVRPIVSAATEKTGATAAYKRLTDQAAQSTGGLVSGRSWDLDDYVTGKTLDGLFLKLAAEEGKIRANPVARSTDLLKKVFSGR